jgi:predicted dehydrogenase
MLKTMKKHDRIFQLGTQIHAGENYHRVAEIIQSGAIGKVKTVRLWKTGFPPVLGPANYQTPPTNLNWDMWLGPAPYSQYTPERCHFSYRYFLDYSGGVFQDFWCHIADVVWWAIDPKNLTRISAKGEAPEGTGDAPKWIDIEYDFNGENKLVSIKRVKRANLTSFIETYEKLIKEYITCKNSIQKKL